jgi:hypothetical protein
MIHFADLDRTRTPDWSQKIERWYQLDELSYSFCEAIHHWNHLKDYPRPDLIVFGLEGASNIADFDFKNTMPPSPSKFVYTLPNICASIIFQMIQYTGQVFFLHQGKNTLEFAQQEARALAASGKKIWFFSSSNELETGKRKIIFEVY